MSRYDWPREFTKSADRLAQRMERALRDRNIGVPPGAMGDLDLLDDVIQTNFDEDRMWMPLGPSIMTNGQATGDPQVAGRVRAIAVSPNGQRIYVGSANGGVWYSSDSGASWTPLGSASLAASANRSDLSLTIGALWVEFGSTGAVDDPAKDVVYVGTGEGLPQFSDTPGSNMGGIGVLRLNGTLPEALAAPLQNPWKREARNLTGEGIFRMARDPAAAAALDGTATLVAATSTGLWSRSGAFSEDADWQRVEFTSTAFANLSGQPHCTDVIWNDKGLWVTLVGTGATDGLYRSPTGLAGPFARITLTNLETGTRLSLGQAAHDTDRMYVLGKVPDPINPGTNSGHAALWRVDLANSVTVAPPVQNVPMGLFVSSVAPDNAGNLINNTDDQSAYDQAICVRQVGANDVVTVGGSLEDNGEWDAAIFDLTITGGAAAPTTDFDPTRHTTAVTDPTFIGAGIHPDVHVLMQAGANLWVGCDGGVFRRSGGTARAMNAGLSVAEPGYLVSHPTIDGPVLAGTQDNGAIQRIGDTVWSLQRKGDGGGCLFHPTKPHQRVMQFINATWQFEPASFSPWGPVLRSNPALPTETAENGRSTFYSQGAAAPATNAGDARIFLGTDRIWYCANWNDPSINMAWVTIPSMTDAHAGGAPLQDQLTENGNSDAVLVIEVLREGDAADGYEGMAILVLCQRTVRIFRFARPAPAAAQAWTAIAQSVVSDPSTATRPRSHKLGDDIPNPFLTYLPDPWLSAWTDVAVHKNDVAGQESFYVATTGQRGVGASGEATSDPVHDTLWWYDGQGRWYPTGLRNTPLDAAAGTGGSPAAAHCVIVDREAPDNVYVGNRIGVWHGVIDQSGTHPTWTWRPAMEGLPHTMVQDLSISSTEAGTFLRAALVSRGVWERDISLLPVSVGRTFIRAVPHDTGRSILPATPKNPLDDSNLELHESPDLVILPTGSHTWDPLLPNEADLLAAPKQRRYGKRVHDVFVMLHHRHTTSLAGADANIDVFFQKDAPAGDLQGFAITPEWRTFVHETVRGNAPPPVAGLSHLGRFNPALPVDARTPRAVKLSVNLNYAGRRDHAMLIAVVTSPGNAFLLAGLAPGNLKSVVRRSHQIAVRKFARV
ncbi:WD40/YVTN/BNR-like repeat-containing protein [Roseobacter sp. EG26]|uniref:WD40/YVTN/BNR-like repeat-containing protein n=1 Tax=Roseobacter sp. EG26 TaxID=3412477 RepID=UPI003CE5BE62